MVQRKVGDESVGPWLQKLRHGVVWLAIALVFGAQAGSSAQDPPPAAPGRTVTLEDVKVTPVEGPSWLEHLNRPMLESSMGETGVWGPSPVQEEGAAPYLLSLPADFARRPMTVTGADLYNLSCRGCHGPRGEGLPPEINSMIAPVQATSAQLILERMKKSGAPISSTVARQLAEQSQTLLLQRIHNGGQNMPAFPQLTQPEVEALVAYLNLLVGIPGAQNKQVQLQMPVAHAGEDLVKGTCHTCHAATGLNPTQAEILQGAVPPLSTLPKRVDIRQFVQKVVAGRPIVMGDLDQRYRGRMPVFYYLTPEQAAAAYVYLSRYAPGTISRSQTGWTQLPARRRNP